ncbi:kinase-like domain-containing protein [Rhizophagus irregularis DAOM 181602=DAOM 197198]|uniref:Kinase-like domain-containing protein n=3 Tax=Rhizophagus irregularis TaxID=588596 RepID=A0A2P4PR22_RHIID|nr:kinase-like domain-containing protein [Rhizophagus irregularis DAOM 181602=DAOM 197198]POG67845.1 kinase-like domain-containing protein [Rhizophagus irregularis DAOM 181602=DAOM 197198]|eukprot:XP_025174711.1 kinase-like domain-containing protein [Rhizophagus irregularis DAOM 181602=DAOM 197198]
MRLKVKQFEMNDFILEKKLRWIPFDKFNSVEYHNEGGFGTIYKAIWLKNNGDEEVILKCHKNLNENLNEFLKEVKIYISDLGLCQPVKSFLKKYDIYGVIPFMAPEVLRGKSYTPASDIYSFSLIMWKFTSGIPPFNDRVHDLQFSLNICKGERPEIIENTPQCYVDLMKKCWNEDSSKRPSSKEVLNIIGKWIFRPYNNDVSEELKSNIMEFINAPIGHNNFATKSHPKACYTSRLLDFTSKKLNEILESENSQAYHASHSDLNDCIIKDLRSLDISYQNNNIRLLLFGDPVTYGADGMSEMCARCIFVRSANLLRAYTSGLEGHFQVI